MARYSYFVLSSAHEGREEEFLRWYDERHLDDVRKIPGVVAARRFNVVRQKVDSIQVPKWQSMAIYEIEADDPKTVLRAIYKASGSEAMPLSPAYNGFGLLEIVGEAVDSSER